jgi:hypothetical protein
MLLRTAAAPPLPIGAPPAEDVFLPPVSEGMRPSPAVLGQVFAGSQVPTGPGWVWGSDLLAAFLSLSRQDSQGSAWGF